MEQRFLYEYLFHGDIADGDKIEFYTFNDSLTDSDIQNIYRNYAPHALLRRMLRHFPRHQWVGGQDVIRMGSLVASTHNLGQRVVSKWLATRENAAEPAPADTAHIPHEGYASEDDVAHPQGAVHEQEDQIVLAPDGPLSKSLAEASDVQWTAFNNKMRGDCKKYFDADPRSELAIMLTMGEAMDKLLRKRIFMSGEQWHKANDMASAQGMPRTFKLIERASNAVEFVVGRKTLTLLHDANAWHALHETDWTLHNRSLAFRLCSRQAAGLMNNLVTPHRSCPDAFFYDMLSGDADAIHARQQRPPCERDDYTNDHIQAYIDDLAGEESVAVATLVVDEACVATVRSECGHSFWQREARLRSVQTKVDSFHSTNATHILHAQRQIERAYKRTIKYPRKPGRKPKKKVMKRPASRWKERRTRNGNQPRKSTWNVFISEDAVRGARGRLNPRGLAARYADIKKHQNSLA